MCTDIQSFLKRQGFALEGGDLEAVAAVFASEARKALRGESSSLQMIDSHLSTGRGERQAHANLVIVVDAGGTNLRVASVRLTENGPAFAHVRKSEMPGTRGAVSADAFHAAVAAVRCLGKGAKTC